MREASTTPLTHQLDKALIPQKCPVPVFECYDGSSDLAAHLRYYNRVLARWEQNNAVLCRYFPSSLKGSALSLFDNLPPNSIDSYSQLCERFLRTYMYNKDVNAGMDKLFSLAIAYKEIREYTDMWHKICQAIGNADPVVSINCYKWGLDRMSPLFFEIHGSVPTTEGDLRIIIEKHAHLEEIQRENPRAQMQRSHRTNSAEQVSGSKRGNSAERPREDSRGRRDDRRRDERKFEDQVFTKLNTNYTRVLREIKDLEGDLKQYIQKADNEDKTKRSKQVQLPEGNRTLNTISCSEATRPSSTTQIGKRLRKQFEDYCELYKIDGVEVDEHDQWMNAPMTFDVGDIDDDMEDHNDPLVLTLPVEGCNIKKILIDGGSSGFNGAPTKPLGYIGLQVDAGPMKVDTRFSVVDAPSPYNAIIGRRWMHKLKGVAATYHQYLGFPIPEGVMKIKGDQITARERKALQNQINNEQDEQRKSRRARNKEAAKEKAIDLYLEEISGRSLTKESIVLNAKEVLRQ
ncbi:uncharacterized protein LOC113305712 [Papaver somniferum]|uniref:uncharacterized protein LOC113305712 n=1 Tax=Papaver somniferum TaxID=3469 RepID=UPI000E6F80F4|nr:uncharacterized protein LOC113305712 [Papaver somniferum]